MTDAKLPWMAWDIPAYMGDTIGFKVEHHGAYLMLLAAVWMGKGRFKFDSMQDLMDAAHCTPEQWERVRGKVLAKFDVDEDGCLTQKRLAEEWARAGKVRDVRKAAGKAGGEAKAKRLAERSNCQPGATANGKQKGRQLPPQSHSTNVEINPLGQAAPDPAEIPAPTPEQLFEGLWADYPRRAGGNSRADAFKAFAARLKAGASVDEIHAGLIRYKHWCIATGKVGTQFVMQGATFFGPGLHWQGDFPLPAQTAPASRAERRAATMNGLGTPSTDNGEDHGTDWHEPIEVQARIVPNDFE